MYSSNLSIMALHFPNLVFHDGDLVVQGANDGVLFERVADSRLELGVGLLDALQNLVVE